MKYIYRLSVISILFLSCNRPTSYYIPQTFNYKLDKTIQSCVDTLSTKYEICINDTADTILQTLLTASSDKDLVALTNHDKASVRCYAFHGLADRNYAGIKDIFYEHVTDTFQILYRYIGSCLVTKMPVNFFMLDQLHPVGSKCKYRFDRKEFKEYWDMFLKQE